MWPPSACTACVIGVCLRAAALVDSVPERGLAHPSMFGAKPPVTIRPTPPRARSAK